MKRTLFFLFAPEGGEGGAGGGGQGAGGAAGAAAGAAAGGDPGAGGAAAGAAGGGAAPARPDYVPEKFWKDGKADFEGMGKSYTELERNFHSRQPAGVVVPGEGAAPEAVAAYRKAIGVPDAPDGYQLKPEKLPEGVSWHDERGKAFAEFAHKQGMTQAQASAAVAFLMEQEAAQMGDARLQYDNLMAQRAETLKKAWGDNYNAKLGVTKQVATALGYDPNDAELFGNPKVVEFLGKVSGMLSEDSVAGLRQVVGGTGKFSTPAEEARDIIRNPQNPMHQRYVEGDPAVKARVKHLYDSAGE
jgi:hypothetical protein